MATPEALIKYYDCLKDSFNKIQLKDNKTALVNAALRPKIRDEFVKSKDLLVSYLNYIQVFTLIYSEKFTSICISIICPLFKEYPSNSYEGEEKNKDVAQLIHNTLREILKSKPELTDEFIHCLIKFFPNIYNDGHDVFINYLSNSLETCGYVRGEPLTNLVAKILDRLNPPAANITKAEEENSIEIRKLIEESYELINKQLETLDKRQKDNLSAAILAAFTREFLTSENESALNYLVLYICSLDEKLLELFINLLWATFTNIDRPFEERHASVCFACSFMSRASYVSLEKVLNYLETATGWCSDYLTEHSNELTTPSMDVIARNEAIELYYVLFHSVLYLITQRYREMYEVESIDRLKKLDLDRFLASSTKPLEVCDIETEQRFREVAALYDISVLKPIDKVTPARKKRKSTNVLGGAGGGGSSGSSGAAGANKRPTWRVPFKDTDHSLPDHIRPLYRNYYDHRNFTVYRE